MNEQLEFCKICVNRSFHASQGIVCGLTNAKPTFVQTCPDFNKDSKEERRLAAREAMLEAEVVYDDHGKPVPVWRVVVSILVFILVIIRLAMRCSNS